MTSSGLFSKFGLSLAAIAAVVSLARCKGSEILAPEPSALDNDRTAPACGGIKTLTLTSGPSITVEWHEGADNVSSASKLNYYVYMRNSSQQYELVSPSKIVVGATTTQITSGVQIGYTYTLFVSCKDEAGNIYPTGPLNEQTISVADTTSPSTISDLAAGSVTFTSILLTWSPSDDGPSGTTASNIRYRIYASQTTPVSTSGSPLTTLTGTTSYLHSSLNPNERWYYKVVALDVLGNASGASNEPTNITTDDTTAPTFAGNTTSLAMSSNTTTTISLSWSAASDNVTAVAGLRYTIYRCTGSTSCDPFAGTVVTTTAAGVTTYTDTGLSDSTYYTYGVRARDYRNNLSTNTDKLLASTVYSTSSQFYAYPTLSEVFIHMGRDVAVANVVGTASGASAYPDLIVGAPVASEGNARWKYTGCVYIFAGTGVGQFSQTASKAICAPGATADGTAAGNFNNFGFALAATDVDGDGYSDLLISFPSARAIYAYRTQYTAGTNSLDTPTTSSFSIAAPGTAGTTYGWGLCTGDLDGTGMDDIVVTAPGDNCANAAVGNACGINGTGNFYVYRNTTTLGGAFSVPNTLTQSQSPAVNVQGMGGFTLTANEQLARRCTIGKFDNNNPSNTQLILASGQPSAAAATADGLLLFYNVTLAATPVFTFQNGIVSTTLISGSNSWGEAVSGIQIDTATKELAVGAPTDSAVGTSAGAVYLYRVTTSGGNFQLTDTGTTLFGGRDFNNNGVGSAVTAANIFNHSDGTQDLVYGAFLEDRTNVAGATALDQGDVFVHQTAGGDVSTTVAQYNFDVSNLAANPDQNFGWAMCSGDVNNDTYRDVIIGSRTQDYDPVTMTTNANIGAVYIYHGKAVGEIDFTTPNQILYAPGDQASGFFGTSCVVMDRDRDGQNDLLVGSYGRTVGGTANRGVVYVYSGAANSALPTINSAVINSPSTAAGMFGYAMASGDWDGDGYPDLAISAINIASTAPAIAGAGRVYVYWALTTTHAIPSTPNVTLYPPNGAYNAGVYNGNSGNGHSGNPYLTNTRTMTAANPNFGFSLASFGTRPKVSGVQGQDLIVCSPTWDVALADASAVSPAMTDQGICFIFEGAIASTGAAVTNGTYAFGVGSANNEIRNSDTMDAAHPNVPTLFGTSMTVGRWNSDAYDDLIICATQARNVDLGVNNVGGCYAYFGATTGIGGFDQNSGYRVNHSSRSVPLHNDKVYDPLNETALSGVTQFGRSVLLLDVNNNSSSDLLIGAPDADSLVQSGYTPPVTKGRDSGRVYIMRGGF